MTRKLVARPNVDVLARLEPESSVLRKVQEALWLAGGVHVMRNNVGRAKGGKLRYGLGVGSADLVCIVAPSGRWLCIETKRPKNAKIAAEQTQWLEMMRRYGAVAGICRTAEEAIALVVEAREPANA